MPALLKKQTQINVQACFFYLYLFFSLSVLKGSAQTPVPYGVSLDSIYIDDFFSKLGYQTFHLYKPTTYDPLTSPILFLAHGSGGSGASAINAIDSIAYRRKALIIAPNFGGNAGGFTNIMRHQEPIAVSVDSIDICIVLRPSTVILKKIYDYVLFNESRANVPCYMIGFSAGGQFVSRYMLIRQAYPDSLPLKMAVSASAYYYTFPTDTFMGTTMNWLCGLIMPTDSIWYCPQSYHMYSWNCDEQVVQYYNENYGVLVGSADLAFLNDNGCVMVQGTTRWERAHTFYDFCDSNAVNRGTTLQWPYAEIPGVGHTEYNVYNNKYNVNDSSSIAESMLFDTPYHTVPFTAPVASFYADTTKIYINGTVNFTNTSINSNSYLWDFGDGTTSTLANPSHTYITIDTFRVQLTCYNSTGCWNWTEKRHYIKIVNPVSVFSIKADGLQINVSPNPATDKLNVTVNGNLNEIELTLTDASGRKLNNYFVEKSAEINISQLSKGVYFYTVYSGNKQLGNGRFVKN